MATTKAAAKPTPTKTAAKPTPAKPVAAKAPAAKAKPAPKVPAPSAPPVAAPVIASVKPAAHKAAGMLKLKDLLDQVVKTTGGKKKGIKEIIEATLHSLGDALHKGFDLNLPPLGKTKVSRQRDLAEGEVIMIKLRRGGTKATGKKAAKEGLADAED